MAMKKGSIGAVLVLLLSLGVLNPARSDYLPVQIEKQKTNSWCWAASAVAVLNRYLTYPGLDVELNQDGNFGQCLLATRLFEMYQIDIDCCDPANEAVCKEGSYNVETIEIMNSAPYRMDMSTDGYLSNQDIETMINDMKAPFIMTLNGGGTAHDIVAVGLSLDKSKLTVMDPWDGEYKEETIAAWKNGTSDDGRPWVSTLGWEASSAPTPPDEVMLRRTAISGVNKYSFTTPGTITTDSLQIESGAEIELLATSGDPIILGSGTTIEKGAKFCASPSESCSY